MPTQSSLLWESKEKPQAPLWLSNVVEYGREWQREVCIIQREVDLKRWRLWKTGWCGRLAYHLAGYRIFQSWAAGKGHLWVIVVSEPQSVLITIVHITTKGLWGCLRIGLPHVAKHVPEGHATTGIILIWTTYTATWGHSGIQFVLLPRIMSGSIVLYHPQSVLMLWPVSSPSATQMPGWLFTTCGWGTYCFWGHDDLGCLHCHWWPWYLQGSSCCQALCVWVLGPTIASVYNDVHGSYYHWRLCRYPGYRQHLRPCGVQGSCCQWGHTDQDEPDYHLWSWRHLVPQCSRGSCWGSWPYLPQLTARDFIDFFFFTHWEPATKIPNKYTETYFCLWVPDFSLACL